MTALNRIPLAERDAQEEKLPLLQVRGLRTCFESHYGSVTAVNELDLTVYPGEVLALVGESGCGKSVTAMSLMRLVEAPGQIESGQISFDGRDLLTLSTQEMTELRGAEIAMIFQQPKGSLNPVKRIGSQIAEQFERRRGMPHAEAWKLAVGLLERVGIPGANEKANAYPHQLSGGQAQRVMTAIALALEPRLLIADEPTTALDVTVQAQILRLLTERCRSHQTALILVTHDLGVVAQVADRVAVMYAGRIVEEAPVETLFANPSHPYTQGLLNAIPRGNHYSESRLEEIPGTVPVLGRSPEGCGFSDRCQASYAGRVNQCPTQTPPTTRITPEHTTRCWIYHSGDGQ